MKTSFTPLLMIPVIILSMPLCAMGASKRDIIRKEKKLEDVRKQIREEKKGIKAASAQEGSILGELEEINKSLVEKRDELKTIDMSLGGIKKNITSANIRISGLEKERQALSLRLNQRLKAMYELRQGEMIRILFSSDSSADLGRKEKYLTMIMDSDARLIADYERNLSKIKAEKESLNQLYVKMDSARRAAIVKRGETAAVRRKKTILLASIRRDKGRREKDLKELEQAAIDLTELIKRLKPEEGGPSVSPGGIAVGFARMKGKLRMPVEGNVVSFYGRVKHPRFRTVTFNNGVIIEAPVGAPVRSVYDGKVIYVGWLKGYGLVLIIDNGSSFYTLFAHLSKSLKYRGDTVKKGETVGYVGDSGPSNSSGLYFEIRQRGVPRDPMPWFAKK